jgi:hypothetical protein
VQTSTAPTIRLRLRELAQLFNSMDPSPFVDRDLDADAEEFITSWAGELPPGNELTLVIQLTVPAPADRIVDVEDGIRHYFSARANTKGLELSQLMRRGRLSLGVGLVFLTLCLSLGGLIARSGFGAAAEIITEGFTIVGWVAMWRPLEIYLYEWWPLHEERQRLDRLARIKVRVVMPDAGPSSFTDMTAAEPTRGEITETAA